MRKISMVVAAVVAASALSACGSSGGTSAKASPSPSVNKDATFIQEARLKAIESWKDSSPTDEDLLVYPHQWCDQLSVGHSVTHILGMDSSNSSADLYPIGANWGTKLPEAEEVFVVAVNIYCPQYRQQVITDLHSSGSY